MDLFKGHSEADAAANLTPGTSRRTFMRGVAATLGIAVPAFKVLVSPSVASAKAIPNINPCTKTYSKFLEQTCGGVVGCPSGDAYSCNQQWQRISSITGQSCGFYITTAGRCGQNSCGGAAPGSSAQATC